jgi:hypothetical protein
MSNIQKLSNGNNNQRLFADTILTFMNSQGFYSRLYREINSLNMVGYKLLCEELEQHEFKDVLDVIFWLET